MNYCAQPKCRPEDRLNGAYQARAKWKQGEERLEVEKNLFRVHCNHLNLIPHYSEWWERNRLRGTLTGSWCCVCQNKLKQDKLLAEYECTKREQEVSNLS